MAIKQKVILEIYDSPEEGNLILQTETLRVDFDVRMIPNFNKAKVVVYNLNNDTITSIMAGERYVTIKTQLHDGEIFTVMDRYYVNNAVDELILPNRITSLYCFSNQKRSVLEKPIDITVRLPSLKNCVTQCASAAGFTGEIRFLSFPEGRINEQPFRLVRSFSGNFIDVLKELGEEYTFNFYLLNGDLVIMHKPDLDNVETTDLVGRETVTLRTEAMRSNPKIGLATAVIDSNLDPSITTTTVIDLSNLITLGVEAGGDTLELLDSYLKNFSSFSKYQAFAVQHKGSNYTADWNTKINALSPTEGKLSPTVNWANIDRN